MTETDVTWMRVAPEFTFTIRMAFHRLIESYRLSHLKASFN
jgi:hypothetical protein